MPIPAANLGPMRTNITWLFLMAGLSSGVWGDPVPDFSLVDVNPGSERRNSAVSPRDYLFQVSGYYFGAAH